MKSSRYESMGDVRMSESIENTVVDIIKKITKTDSLQSRKDLLDLGILDSLSIVELVTRLEKEFCVRLAADDFTHQNFNSVDAICALVSSKRS